MSGESDVGALPTVPQSLEHGGGGARLAAGARAGDYVIDGYLGGGGMGEVYAGHHPVIGKKVAVKVIRPHLATSPEAVARFTREARAVNQVDHANVVDVFALGRLDDGRLFLVMDLVAGETLRARLAGGRCAPAEALAALVPIAAALDAAHARGVVHRDLKPDNVMVSGPADRPTVHVLDFGIAKLVSSVATEHARAAVATATLTGHGTWLGTPAYMAPEQWSSDGAIPASDRYALAVMTYELLAGSPPFAASTAPGLMEQHFRAEVPSVTAAGAAVPAAVDAVLRRAMAKDPEQRFPSAMAMVEALGAALATPAGAARRPRGRGPGRVPLIAGGLGVAVTGAGMWIVLHDRSPSASGDPTATTGTAAEIISTPAGATVVVDGVEVGVTPRRVDVAAGGSELVLRKPGYHPKERLVVRGETWPATLAPVVGFEGTWALPDGELRRFVRQGDVVVALRLAAASAPGEFYRRFQFVPSTAAATSFVAEEDHVHPGHAHEPTCHIPLKAQYDYDAGGDELELRNERARIDVTPLGKCVVAAIELGEARALTRIDRAADTGTWAESRAGAGLAIGVTADPGAVVDNPGFQPKEPLADDGAPPVAPPQKTKRPPAKPAPRAQKPQTKQSPNRDVTGNEARLGAQTRATISANPPPFEPVSQGADQAAADQQAPAQQIAPPRLKK